MSLPLGMVLVLALKGRRAADGGPLARSLAPLFLNGTLYSQCDGDGGEASLLLWENEFIRTL